MVHVISGVFTGGAEMMRRLTLLTTGLGRGGAEAQVALLARTFQARGYGVEVISMIPPEAHTEELAAAGIPVRSLNMRAGVADPRALFRLAGMLRASRPHILHCHMVHANLLGRLVRLLARVPVVISTAHSVNEGSRWREWAYRVTDSLCDLTTQVSRTGAERYRRIGAAPAHKILWIENGLDVSAHGRNAEDRQRLRSEWGVDGHFVWLAVGNPRQAKDYPTMLEAMVALANHPREHTLLIVGSGKDDDVLRQLAGRRGLDGRVRWLGSRGDVPALMSAVDGFVMSSSWEGTPIALLEAAASELPVVATRVGGIPEAVDEGRSGYLVSPGAPDALAEAMGRVMNLGEAERLAMGRAGRERVAAAYGIEAIAAKWIGIYDDLLSRAGIAEFGGGAVKRALDLIISVVGLVALAPLLALIALGVRLSSPGPVLFRQARLGLKGKPFELLKFRSMQVNCADLRCPDGSTLSSADDPRVTRSGRFLRRTSLDELPQLWNVLHGEMSLVGPRPDQVDQLRYYRPDEFRKLNAKPGLTGLAQISGRNAISWERRKQLDVEYTERASMALDLIILSKTIPYVLSRRDVNATTKGASACQDN